MKIAICDDSKSILEYMSEKIKGIFFQQKYNVSIKNFDNSKELVKCLNHEFFDVIFLDVDMPNFSGFDVAKKMQASAAVSTIIFVSNLEESVYESLQFRPFRFIRKSHFKEEITSVIEALLKALAYPSEYVILSLSNEQIRLYPHKIKYIECNDKTLKIVSNLEIIKLRYRLRDIETLLKEYGFIRIHKGYLVNSKYIYRIIKSGEIILESGEKLPISKRRVKEVYEELGRLMV
jgi:DNA-binding LytR/AlgR family response regulator